MHNHRKFCDINEVGSVKNLIDSILHLPRKEKKTKLGKLFHKSIRAVLTNLSSYRESNCCHIDISDSMNVITVGSKLIRTLAIILVIFSILPMVGQFLSSSWLFISSKLTKDHDSTNICFVKQH